MPKSTLAQHIQDCELRYQKIDLRLTNLEQKVDRIIGQIDDFRDFFLKLTIRLGIGVVIALCSAVFVIKV